MERRTPQGYTRVEAEWREVTWSECEASLVVHDNPCWGRPLGHSITEGPRPGLGTVHLSLSVLPPAASAATGPIAYPPAPFDLFLTDCNYNYISSITDMNPYADVPVTQSLGRAYSTTSTLHAEPLISLRSFRYARQFHSMVANRTLACGCYATYTPLRVFHPTRCSGECIHEPHGHSRSKLNSVCRKLFSRSHSRLYIRRNLPVFWFLLTSTLPPRYRSDPTVALTLESREFAIRWHRLHVSVYNGPWMKLNFGGGTSGDQPPSYSLNPYPMPQTERGVPSECHELDVGLFYIYFRVTVLPLQVLSHSRPMHEVFTHLHIFTGLFRLSLPRESVIKHFLGPDPYPWARRKSDL